MKGIEELSYMMQKRKRKQKEMTRIENENKKKQNRTKKQIVLISIMLLLGFLCICVPSVKQFLASVIHAFYSGDFTKVRDFVAHYGAYAAAVSFLLMIFQSIAAPIPAFVLTLANANLFGWWQGAILSWSSAMAGAAVCFYIARILGRDITERLTSRAGLENIDTFFEKHGSQSILIARLLPFISFDIVSYAAGLTAMSFGEFFLATGIGQLPATIVYSYVGGMLTGGAKKLFIGLLIMFAIATLIIMLRQIYQEKQKKKEEKM